MCKSSVVKYVVCDMSKSCEPHHMCNIPGVKEHVACIDDPTSYLTAGLDLSDPKMV